MKIDPFRLERYFAKYEFSTKYLFSSSDCDGFLLNDILSLATTDEMELWQNLKLGYTESQGLPLLRDEISTIYQNITSNQVLVLAPEEGIFIAFNCILSKDDHVVCISPSYQSLSEVVKSIGCSISYWTPDEHNGWHFNPLDIERLIRTDTKLIIINFPHNPTGYIPSLEDFEEIVHLARKNNIYLFSDEMYRFLEFDSNQRLASASDIYPNSISLFGLSKTFGLAGLRLGWLTTQNEKLMHQMLAFKDYTTICSSAPSEILALIALRHREQLIEINIKKIKNNLALLDGFIIKHSSFLSWTRPTAGTIGFLRINLKDTSYNFCERLVAETGIMAVPGELFDYDDKHIRVGFGRSNFPEVLDVFDKYLHLYNDFQLNRL